MLSSGTVQCSGRVAAAAQEIQTRCQQSQRGAEESQSEARKTQRGQDKVQRCSEKTTKDGTVSVYRLGDGGMFAFSGQD